MRSGAWILGLMVAACTPKEDVEPDETDVSDLTDVATATGAYSFPGRTGVDAVVYDGQVFRHLLLRDFAAQVAGLTARIDGGWLADSGEVARELLFYLDFDGETSSEVPHGFVAGLPTVQEVYGDVSSGKNLIDKVAGRDPVGQHADWTTEFVGWDDPRVSTPESLILRWILDLDEAASARVNGDIPLGPDGRSVPSVALTADGRDLHQLLQKFMTGAIAYSQGVDDYLDDDLPGSGLLSDHSAVEDGKPYTALEHAWDEGFGYFGASRDRCGDDDATIAEVGWSDTVRADGAVDLLTEVCWGHAVNAAKRDVSGVLDAPLGARAWAGFLAGRRLIAEATGPLTEAELATLRGHRDEVVSAWELTLATTVVHYLNETLAHTRPTADASYDFAAHAKAWSEAKGFALSLQFNPRSRLSDEAFATLHEYLGMAPVLPGDAAAVEAAREDLRAARALLGEAYDLSPSALGDAEGLHGL